MTIATAFTVAGLVIDLVGALLFAWGLFITPEEAAELTVSRWPGHTLEEQVLHPQAADRLKQSRRAKIGVALLTLGFTLQIVGALIR